MPTSTDIQNLKINTLTEAQYDAAVLGGVIGANELSILTDAQSSDSLTVTLAAADWSGNAQTVTATGVTASNTIFVGPAPASSADWATGGVLCTAQGTDSLGFTCTTTPTNDITVNVSILS